MANHPKSDDSKDGVVADIRRGISHLEYGSAVSHTHPEHRDEHTHAEETDPRPVKDEPEDTK